MLCRLAFFGKVQKKKLRNPQNAKNGNFSIFQYWLTL